MDAARYDFEIRQGGRWAETWDLPIAGVTSAAGYACRLDIRAGEGAASTLLISLTQADRSALSVPASGTLRVAHNIPRRVTADFPPGLYRYSFIVIPPSGEDYADEWLSGVVTVVASTVPELTP